MALAAGSKLGSYEIVAPLGAGGMGDVYRARDTKLGREVALKILPDISAEDPERRARFEREARTLASLKHPSIVTIYAIEESDGTHFIAMECVEGQTLGSLLSAGRLPLERLLAIATQLADAVGSAHKHGIVHRDLKPANVMVGSHDRVTVLDFGLAKLREAAPVNEATILPAREITGEGRIIGTVSYMSPEQAEARSVDDRSDIFSLGVILYEMVSGERPFKGETSLSTLSSILRDSPKPLLELSPSVPRDLSRIVGRCLEKDPDKRYQSAIDLRHDLEDVKSAPRTELPAAAAASHAGMWRVATVSIAALAAVVIGWLLLRAGSSDVEAAPEMTFARLTLSEAVSAEPAVSPDGKWVAFVGGGSPTHGVDILLQSATGSTAINLTKDSPDVEGSPAFSPDGEQILFRSTREGGGLFVMGRTGESVRRVTRSGFGPAWFPDGRQFVFATVGAPLPEGRAGAIGELWVGDTAGGEPRRIFAGDAVQPQVSPHGLRIAFWGLESDAARTRIVGSNRDIWTVAIDGTDPRRATTEEATDWNPVWSPDGKWLYYLSNRSGSMNLWRVAIDEKTGIATRTPQPLSAPASYIRNFSLSADGRVGAYATFSVVNNLARVQFDPRTASTRGQVEPITSGPRDFGGFDVSPDGRQLVVATSNRQQEDLYVIATDGSATRSLTNDPVRDRTPRWSPDGKQVTFYSDRTGFFEIWSIDHDGGGLRQLTKSDSGRTYPSISPDGSRLAAIDLTSASLYLYETSNYAKTPELVAKPPELSTANFAASAMWSPDGKLIALPMGGGWVWIYSFETKASKVLPGPGAASIHWLPDSRRLLVSRLGRISVVDWVTGEMKDVFSLPGEGLGVPRTSRDAAHLYFLRAGASGDIWTVRFKAATDSQPR